MPPLVEHLPPSTAREKLIEYFHRNRQGYRCIAVRFAAAHDKSGEWQCALWAVRGVAHDEPETVDRDLVYRNFRLRQARLDVDQFRDLLDEVLDQGRLLDNAGKTSDISGTTVPQHILSARNQFADRSGEAWVFSGAGRPEVPWGPLAEFGLPYHSDALSAIAEWIDVRDWHGSADARIGGGLVYLPEARASFESFEMTTPTRLAVQVRRAPWFEPALRIKGVVRDDDHAEVIDLELAGDTVQVPVLEDADHLELAIVADGGLFLDWHRETPEAVVGVQRALSSGHAIDEEAREVLDLVEDGESDRVEFKAFVTPGEQPKWKDVFESVCAFANTLGGTLLIGVDDHGVVRGVEAGALAWAKGKHPPEQVSIAYARELRRQIGNVIAPVPPTSVDVVRVAEHDVVVLKLPDSPEKPHELIESREVFIRRGATDRRVSVQEFGTLIARGAESVVRRRRR